MNIRLTRSIERVAKRSQGAVRSVHGSVLVPFWSPLAVTAPNRGQSPSGELRDYGQTEVIKNPSRLNTEGLTKLASDQAFSVALIDLCSSKYPTGVETEKLRRIRGSLDASVPAGIDTLPDIIADNYGARSPRRKWKRLSAEARSDVVARYSAGETSTILAKEYGVAKSTILGILRANNVVVRRQPLTREQVSEATRLYESGLSLSQAAEALKVNQETMRTVNIGVGVKIRPARRN